MKLLNKDQFEDHWFELGVQDRYEAEFGDLITVEEISTIKERVGLAYHTVVVGSVYDILENKESAPEETKKSTPNGSAKIEK